METVRIPYEQHLVTVERKSSLFTGTAHWQKTTQTKGEYTEVSASYVDFQQSEDITALQRCGSGSPVPAL